MIAGTPPTSVTQGATYSFTPTAPNQDGTALRFGIDAKPSWASFNTATGQLTGTPSAADVGTYRGIVIWVTDGTSDAALPAFDLTVQGQSTANNKPPIISGSPARTAVAGTIYAFAPVASDADDDPLTFTIVNGPTWAQFDSATGALTGTPTVADVGATSGIVISVSDGKVSMPLPAFSIAVVATATGSAMITWNPPTTNTDGSALNNLAGYKIYWGTTQGVYPSSVPVDNPGVSSYVVTNLVAGTYFFVMTSLNAAGEESEYSNAVSKTVQ